MVCDAKNASQLVHDFFQYYLVTRSYDDTMSCFSDDIWWYGTGSDDEGRGIAAVGALIKRDFRIHPAGFDLQMSKFYEQKHNSDLSTIFYEISACSLDTSLALSIAGVRAFINCKRTEKGWKIVSMHSSVPMSVQEEGDFFPARGDNKDNRADFDRYITRKSAGLIHRSIPGGVMGRYLEPGFPLYYINERMLKYLGFSSQQEFEKAIAGRVETIIHPDDCTRVSDCMQAALANSNEFDVRYRVRKQDGSWIWVSDVGRKGIAHDGRFVILSVVTDINDEVEVSARLHKEIEEKEKQYQRYNSLFQSVTCGIVHYRVLKDGTVEFKDANREAIRIFDFTYEEFWAHKVWDLAEIVYVDDLSLVVDAVSQLKHMGDKSNYEYRVRQRDGSGCWIIGKAEFIADYDGEQVIQSVYIDINDGKQAQYRAKQLSEQVEAGNVLLKMALEHTSACEFYYYPQDQRAVLPLRTAAHYNCMSGYENMPDDLAQDLVAVEWRDAYDTMFYKMRHGERNASAEFKTKQGNLWCRMTMSTASLQGTEAPTMVVGIMEDITKAKNMEFALERARSRDALTDLYSREAGVRKVCESMVKRSPTQKCALMLLDLDDFKSINESEGKVFGDVVLQEVSRILMAETMSNDILIRLGGDEFMIFLSDCAARCPRDIGTRITEKIRDLLVADNPEFKLSASIGIGTSLSSGSYTDLYRSAEMTLQYVKEYCRGTASCFEDQSEETGALLSNIYTKERVFDEIINDNAGPSEDLLAFALELMGKAKRLDDALILVLARTGKAFGLDRICIVEANQEYQTLHVPFQWGRTRGDRWAEKRIFLTREQYDVFVAQYDDDGVNQANDAPDGFASCFKIAFWNQGAFAGAMCFESRAPNFEWPDDTRRILRELTKLVASFIMKARSDAVSRAKSDFLSRMSHEIRTPMNAIAGMTNIAKSFLDDKTRLMGCLTKIEAANRYLLDLINDVLDMSRIESGKLELNVEDTNISEQMVNILALVTPQADARGVMITLENMCSDLPKVKVDMLRLNQVLVNIIGNAIKFTERGGQIVLKIDAIPRESSAPRLGVASEGSGAAYGHGVYMRFAVRDTGIGISPEEQLQIFNAFEQAGKQTTLKYGGTGLGLSISSRLVQMMGGVLEVESAPGKGSEFFFTLPLEYSEERCLPAVPAMELPVLSDFNGVSILLVEDNEINREIAETLLTMKGMKVESAADGLEAINVFASREPWYYDAIFMDIRMPVMDGLEATRKIRTMSRPDSIKVPIIALTANAFDADSKKSLESGMNGHVAKPILLDNLLEVLSACLQAAEVEKHTIQMYVEAPQEALLDVPEDSVDYKHGMEDSMTMSGRYRFRNEKK